jgi:hypothetical protein
MLASECASKAGKKFRRPEPVVARLEEWVPQVQ